MSKMGALVPKARDLIMTGITMAKPRLIAFGKYAVVELTPPKPTELRQVASGVSKIINSAKTGSYKQLPMKDVIRNTLVTIEVMMWFFIGECIGKRNIIGYNV